MKKILILAAFALLTASVLSSCNGDTPSVTEQPSTEVTTDITATDAPPAEEKAEISHRGKALGIFAEKLATYLKK